MKIVLLTGGYCPDKAARAAALAAAEPTAKLILPGADALAAATPAAAPPVLRMCDYIGREGQFAHVLLMKKMAAVINDGHPPALVLDSVANTSRYSDLDAHGRGADYLTAAIAKALYWEPRRPALIHFCLPSMQAYFAREWGKYVYYAPVESMVAWHANVPELRVQGMIHRAAARLAPHQLSHRIKQKFGLTVVGKVARMLRLVRR
jgi:hypothetical protein